jgi:hypothetical protein
VTQSPVPDPVPTVDAAPADADVDDAPTDAALAAELEELEAAVSEAAAALAAIDADG